MNDMVYLPLTNMSAEIVGNNALTGVAINGFWLKSSNADRLEAAEFQVTNVLRLRHNIHPPKESGGRFVLSLIVGVLAGGIPARNAAKLDPILALHGD
jgi:ABC-type antimicrobial peptide transport system permease subunit